MAEETTPFLFTSSFDFANDGITSVPNPTSLPKHPTTPVRRREVSHDDPVTAIVIGFFLLSLIIANVVLFYIYKFIKKQQKNRIRNVLVLGVHPAMAAVSLTNQYNEQEEDFDLNRRVHYYDSFMACKSKGSQVETEMILSPPLIMESPPRYDSPNYVSFTTCTPLPSNSDINSQDNLITVVETENKCQC